MKNNNIFVRMSVVCTIIMTVTLLGAGMVEEIPVLAMSQLSRKVDERPMA